MSNVSIRGLQKRYGDSLAVKGLDLEIEDGEFVTLLGPSGCGKTTTLRCLAGLEVPTAGEITLGKRTVFSDSSGVFVPPEERGLGMVFQSYALWPHMTVGATVGYPLKLAKKSRAETARGVKDILERVHLSDRVSDPAVALSGGQQQRVALARAMVNRPPLILFDEPLSNLDVKLRHSMRTQIRALHDEMGTTSVYVTHDQEEAIALADRVVVMSEGRIEQLGTAREVYTSPRNAFVADFMGFQNIFGVRVTAVEDGIAVVEVDDLGARIQVRSDGDLAPGDRALVAFRAGHVHVTLTTDEERAHHGEMTGVISNVTYLGNALRILVDAGTAVIRAQVDERDFGNYGPDDLVPGRSVRLTVPPRHMVALPGPGHPDFAEASASTMTVQVPA